MIDIIGALHEAGANEISSNKVESAGTAEETVQPCGGAQMKRTHVAKVKIEPIAPNAMSQPVVQMIANRIDVDHKVEEAILVWSIE